MKRQCSIKVETPKTYAMLLIFQDCAALTVIMNFSLHYTDFSLHYTDFPYTTLIFPYTTLIFPYTTLIFSYTTLRVGISPALEKLSKMFCFRETVASARERATINR